MIEAIVYVSQTGHTKQYAELLGEKTGLPVYALDIAQKKAARGSEVIYFGWLMAGKVKGYKKASKYFTIKALCGVGMANGDAQLTELRKANQIPENMPLFYLPGGFQMEKLHGIYKLMMKTMKATVGKGLSEKTQRTPEEDDMLNLLLHGGNTVSADHLSEVLGWYKQR